jgi:hypothetical protein
LAVALTLAAIAAAADLLAPRRSDFRRFDPEVVGRLDAAMWRSYYDRERFLLFRQLAALLRSQYHLPPLRSYVVATHAARAAFVFKDGTGRGDYERALPHLVDFYAALRRASVTPFDVDRAARLELEWWIVRREPAGRVPGVVEQALAALQAEIYRLPAERLGEHARLRAEAMAIRDGREAAGGVSAADWAAIERLLAGAWRALHAAVNS